MHHLRRNNNSIRSIHSRVLQAIRRIDIWKVKPRIFSPVDYHWNVCSYHTYGWIEGDIFISRGLFSIILNLIYTYICENICACLMLLCIYLNIYLTVNTFVHTNMLYANIRTHVCVCVCVYV